MARISLNTVFFDILSGSISKACEIAISSIFITLLSLPMKSEPFISYECPFFVLSAEGSCSIYERINLLSCGFISLDILALPFEVWFQGR